MSRSLELYNLGCTASCALVRRTRRKKRLSWYNRTQQALPMKSTTQSTAIFVALAACGSLVPYALATNNIISDQIVDGSGSPWQLPAGGRASLADLGLARVPLGSNSLVRISPWSTLPGDIAQMSHFGSDLYFGTTDGQIWRYDQEGNRPQTPLLDLPAERADFSNAGPFSGRGLRGFAFHPRFAENRLLYTMHRELGGGAATHGTLSADAQYVLGEWDFNQPSGEPPAFRSVLRVGYPATDHAGGQIGFNPAAEQDDPDFGLLYAGFGDGGGACSGSKTCINQFGFGQDLSTIQSAVIRIDPLRDGSNPYTIPADNPFLVASDPENNIPDEIFAKGFRNASTMMFDPATGDLLLGDISHNTIEEINLVESGRNYGWGIREGTWIYTDLTNTDDSLRYVPLGDGSDVDALSATYAGKDSAGDPVVHEVSRLTDGFTSPIAQFTHEGNDGRSAIVTGTVYRGTLAPALDGMFLFSNLSQDELYYAHQSELVNDQSPAAVFELVNLVGPSGLPVGSLGTIVGNDRVNLRFGQDGQGELYLISKHNDTIYRLETPGDYDRDGRVEPADYTVWRDSLGATGPHQWADGDANGTIDLADYEIWASYFAIAAAARAQTGSELLPVPEPAQLVLLAWGSLSLMPWRGRGRACRLVWAVGVPAPGCFRQALPIASASQDRAGHEPPR